MSDRQAKKSKFRLRLVIDEEPENDRSWDGYDLDNAKPWPLGTYSSEVKAIAARNAIVILKPKEGRK